MKPVLQPHDFPSRKMTAQMLADIKAKQERVLEILHAFWEVHGLPEPITEAWAQAARLYNELWPS